MAVADHLPIFVINGFLHSVIFDWKILLSKIARFFRAPLFCILLRMDSGTKENILLQYLGYNQIFIYLCSRGVSSAVELFILSEN